MTCVVAKGKFNSNSTLNCSLDRHGSGSMVTLTEPAIWESPFLFSCDRTTSITLNACAMQIDWQPNTSYRILLDEGFALEDNGDPSPSQVIEVTTNDLPSIINSIPANGTLSEAPFNSISLNFDRKMFINPNIGGDLSDNNIKVYEKNSGTLVKIFYYENILLSDNGGSIILDLSDKTILESTSYTIVIGPNMLHDRDNFYVSEITGSEICITTRITSYLQNTFSMIANGSRIRIKQFASQIYTNNSMQIIGRYYRGISGNLQSTFNTSSDPSVVLAADRWITTPSIAFYVEDTVSGISGPSTIVDIVSNGTGPYTITVAPSIVNAVSNITAIISGDATTSYSSETSTLSITGNRTDVNNTIGSLSIVPSPDYNTNITLNYKLYTNNTLRYTKLQTVMLASPFDSELKNLYSFYQYYGKSGTNFFQISSTYISDFDTTPGLEYTITLSASQSGTNAGSGFSRFADGNDFSSTWSYTGTKDQINSILPTISYYPGVNATGTTSFVYTQSKSNLSGNQLSITVPCYYLSNITTSSVYTYTVGSYTWTPTLIEKLYRKMDYLIVGGGGAGGTSLLNTSGVTAGAGGGAGGDVMISLNSNISNNTYPVVVGAGGAQGEFTLLQGVINSSDWISTLRGNNGSLSSFNGNTINGGNGGQGTWLRAESGQYQSTPPSFYGPTPNGGNSTYVGGDGTMPAYGDDFPSSGGGGAGSNANGGNSTSSNEGIGGAGTLSTITGSSIYYGHGGDGSMAYGGSGLISDSSITQYTSYGSGGHGSYDTPTATSKVGQAGKDGIIIIKTHI
jgi:hypothetical protein